MRQILWDWRAWVGLSVSVLALYWTLHDVDLREIGAVLATTEFWPVVWMVAFQMLSIVWRALRWGHLSRAISDQPLPFGALYRATAVGYLALNVLPFRIGEFIRPWALARETGVSASAALGTVVLERTIDFTMIVLMSGAVLYFHVQELPDWVRAGATVLAVLSLFPVSMIIALRMSEARALKVLARLLSPLPERVARPALELVTKLGHGMSRLRGARTWIAVGIYSILLWGAVITAPFALGLYALDIPIGAGDGWLATYTSEVFVALSVAAPAGPGFFGIYHFACREALRSFGVLPHIAVAYGTLLHLTYWIPVTLMGVHALLRSGLSFRLAGRSLR